MYVVAVDRAEHMLSSEPGSFDTPQGGRLADVVIKPEERKRSYWTKVSIDTFV